LKVPVQSVDLGTQGESSDLLLQRPWSMKETR